MFDLNNIVIVGGGSSGWMSAATLIKAFPNKNITVIESPNTPTIGVGESTIGQINEWLYSLNIKDDDWMEFCDASYKLSIKFTDFYKENSGGFHYPFGSPFYDAVHFPKGLSDWYTRKALDPNLPLTNFAETFYPAVSMCEQNKICDNKNNEFNGWSFQKDVAYHFDAAKFGLWLRERFCEPRGVKCISTEVENVIMGEKGVEKLVCTNGEEISADLYIDCTGFKSLLLEQTLGIEFENYNHLIPNNCAWATRLPYSNKELELQPYTNCTALNNGWVWNIPLWSRIGTGYVFCDKYISHESALQEFKNYLINNRDIKVDEEVVESLEFKKIPMKIGIHKKIFHKNVCAIGLAAGFIEPLESTGLYTVHEFLTKLVLALSRDEVSEFDRQAFNEACRSEFKSMAEFVSLHYALSHRKNSKYWLDIRNQSFNKESLLGMFLSFGYENVMYSRYFSNSYGMEMGGSLCIATGMNFLPLDHLSLKRNSIRNSLNFDNQGYGYLSNSVDYVENLKNHFQHWDMLLYQRKAQVSGLPSLLEFLKRKYQKT